jgi:5-methylcytosine-specific restriction protein A|tara:strand:+ start:1139 stop:1546 length:408 start_codon:yes stop_codon:yes gene_type:complete
MTKKLCTFSGCNNVVNHANDNTSPRCTQHSSSNTLRKKYEHHLDELGRNIYKTAMWKRYRKAKLMLNPLCEHCEEYGDATIATVVDHVVEILDGGAVYDINNLQSLCHPHHNTKTGKHKKFRNKPKKIFPSLSDF